MATTIETSLLDTNVILRYLLNDDPDHSPRAAALISSAQNDAASLQILSHIVCEVVYILEGMDYPKTDIFEALRDLGRIPGIKYTEERKILDALIEYKDKNIDFSDALLAAEARAREEVIWTFNHKHFKRLNCSWRIPE
ncbi:MAG: PIN domain-containing protein [bacterium]|nr:PIN domain-containing protein [bacterium]